MSSNDLWGSLPDDEAIIVPVRLLADQADLLGQKTGNLLEARVNPVSLSGTKNLAYELEIIAPVLDNYSITVMRIRHPIESYPVVVESVVGGNPMREATNEAEFSATLREILGSSEVQRIIGSLLSQSKATMRRGQDESFPR
jgi:hypothetical protein